MSTFGLKVVCIKIHESTTTSIHGNTVFNSVFVESLTLAHHYLSNGSSSFSPFVLSAISTLVSVVVTSDNLEAV